MHTRKMSEIKLGKVYKFFNLKFYSVSDEVKILNYKAGAYATLVDMECGSVDFLKQSNFGGTSMGNISEEEQCAEVTGTIRDVAMATICNCIQIKGPLGAENFIQGDSKMKNKEFLITKSSIFFIRNSKNCKNLDFKYVYFITLGAIEVSQKRFH